MEVFNPRVAIGSFNEEAARFAAKYRILAGAGSDAHVAQGLGIGARADARLRRARGVPRVDARGGNHHDADDRCSYVQALKFLRDASATPPGARRAARERRVRRATRKG